MDQKEADEILNHIKQKFDEEVPGIVIFYAMLSSGIDIQVSSIVGIVAATGIRLLAMKYNWNLPKVREAPE